MAAKCPACRQQTGNDVGSRYASANTVTTIRALDGLCLAATLVTPEAAPERVAVLVHGGV